MKLYIAATITFWATTYGVPIDHAMEICRLESSFDRHAIGDDGEALGLWQWHSGSWRYIARKMHAAEIWPKEYGPNMRTETWLSTQAAMYAMGELDLYDWWSTDPIARRNLGEEYHAR